MFDVRDSQNIHSHTIGKHCVVTAHRMKNECRLIPVHQLSSLLWTPAHEWKTTEMPRQLRDFSRTTKRRRPKLGQQLSIKFLTKSMKFQPFHFTRLQNIKTFVSKSVTDVALLGVNFRSRYTHHANLWYCWTVSSHYLALGEQKKVSCIANIVYSTHQTMQTNMIWYSPWSTAVFSEQNGFRKQGKSLFQGNCIYILELHTLHNISALWKKIKS